MVSEKPGEVFKVPLEVVTDAVTEKAPATVLAVKSGALATPLLPVCAVAEVWPLNAALAPPLPALTVNVTVAPDTGLLLESFTVA